uniref:Uncharacterized protein n=1 Tax=Halimeda micronesica TaxID=170426 RepID=A0A386AXC5_9CHLO|nr:hypothetical protein [Halimeda micronesica]
MAIAEHIGYDATGRETPFKNDLSEIIKQYKYFSKNMFIQTQPNDKIFTINQNETEARIDPSYYKPKKQQRFLKNYYTVKKSPCKQLEKLVEFSTESLTWTWNQARKNYYIEIGEIDGEIKNMKEICPSDAPSSAKIYLSGKKAEIPKRNELLHLHLHLHLRGSITRPKLYRGAICLFVIDKHFDGYIASTSFAVIRKIKVDSLDRKYLFYALRFKSTIKQLKQRNNVLGQP